MILGLLFAIVAAFYASVGFGGGSSYLALLVLWKLPYAIIPAIALICNIVVVSGNSFHYARSGYLSWRLSFPLALASVPMSYIGGRMIIGKETFIIILFVSLLATGLRMLLNFRSGDDSSGACKAMPIWLGISMGAVLGFLAGVTGIGGGIFLAPILYNLRAGSVKQIAAASSMFILLNSIAGLIGQIHKHAITESLFEYWYLPLLVFAGGQIGNILMIKFIPARIIALLTALLVLFVAAQLGLRICGFHQL
ncbi:MAG: sulfite exporter TauE/SafE family protein [Rickettsiales bacterium]|jgi:uncharacterized membrane protein YfcA